MTLSDLLRAGAKIQDIARHLDALSHARRAEEVLGLARSEQPALYERAADAPPIELRHFVPDGVEPLREVVHLGRNSQPAFRGFEKRFCRPADGTDRLFGFNETPLRPWIGPGYFVARPTESDGETSDPRGAVVVDYFLVPDAPVVAGWPTVVPNHRGLQRFVYDKTRDYMRKVSEHVSIGKAVRLERRVMGYFVLCRRD